MKIQSVTNNNRKRAFQVKASKKMFQLPYSKKYGVIKEV